MNIKLLCASGLLALSMGAVGAACAPVPSSTSVPLPAVTLVTLAPSSTTTTPAPTTTTSPCDANAVPQLQDCGWTPLTSRGPLTTTPAGPPTVSPGPDCIYLIRDVGYHCGTNTPVYQP